MPDSSKGYPRAVNHEWYNTSNAVHVAQEIPTYEQITPQWIKVGTKEQQIPLLAMSMAAMGLLKWINFECDDPVILAALIMDGSSTTTIGGSHIGMWKLTKVISLPVMREVTATLCWWTKGCFRAVTRSGLRTDPPPPCPQPVTLQATPSRKRPRHLKAQGILCYL